MSQGRGCAILVAAMLILLIFNTEVAQAATYMVGDASGWTFKVAAWPRGKPFRAGDTLVFTYGPSNHNVVAVDKAGFDTCRTPRGAKVFKSGKDQIKLVKGQNFFICNFPGHCESGMKIAVTAF